MYRAQALATYISIPIKLIWPSLCLTVSYCTLLTVKYFYRYVYLLYLIVLYLTVPYLLYLYRYVSSCISGYRSHDKFKLITPDRAATLDVNRVADGLRLTLLGLTKLQYVCQWMGR